MHEKKSSQKLVQLCYRYYYLPPQYYNSLSLEVYARYNSWWLGKKNQSKYGVLGFLFFDVCSTQVKRVSFWWHFCFHFRFSLLFPSSFHVSVFSLNLDYHLASALTRPWVCFKVTRASDLSHYINTREVSNLFNWPC